MTGELSSRLAAVAAFVTPGRPMADIGTDHALLPLSLVREGIVPLAVALDLTAGPLDAARRATAGFRESIDVRQSNGFESLADGEVHTVTLCGMGGQTMAQILTQGLPSMGGLRRVVTQPQGGIEQVRRAMCALHWRCMDGAIVDDRGKLYVVECWERSSAPESWTPDDFRWGKVFRASQDPMYRRWLECELGGIETALQKLRAKAYGHPDEGPMEADRFRVLSELRRLGHRPRS